MRYLAFWKAKTLRGFLLGILLAVGIPAFAIIGGGVLQHTHSSASSGGTTLTGFTSPGSTGTSMVLIQRQVVSAVAQVDFTTGINSTYDEYLFVLSDVTSGGQVYIRVAQASVFKTGAADYSYTMDYYFGVTANVEHAESNSSLCDIANGAGGSAGEVRLFNPSGTTTQKPIIGYVGTPGAVPAMFRSLCTYAGGTSGTPNAAINGIRFLPGAGTISGTFALYGIKKS